MIKEIAEDIYKKLGPGYNECVYHNAFEVALRRLNVSYESERIVPIKYTDHVIGNLRADLIIDSIVVELKAVKTINDSMEWQVKNYLKLLNLNQAYLINFPQVTDGAVEIRHISLPLEKKESSTSRISQIYESNPSGFSTPLR